MKYAALFLAALLFSVPAHAQIKDSYYFMLDDGVQTPDEVIEEAQYVFDTCDSNVFQKLYFDCQCVAGSFLQLREKYGSVAPQEELVDGIVHGKNARCSNSVDLAGYAYENCMETTRFAREYAPDNEQYCSCVGNKVANDFTQRPRLNRNYIVKVHSNAMLACRQRDANNNPAVRGR